MNKIKLICCLLVLILLVVGCSGTPSPATEPPTGPSDIAAFQMPDIPEVSLDPFPVLTEGLYVTSADYDITIYPFTIGPNIYIELFSETPIPEDASIVLDTDVFYKAGISEVKPTGSVETQYPYYLYQCTQGTDWPEMTEAYLRAQYASYEEDALSRQGCSPTPEQEARWKQDRDAYDRIFTAYKDAYRSQIAQWKDSAQPSVYKYRINITFAGRDAAVSDVITEVTLVFSGKSVTFPIGSIRLDGDAALPHPIGEGINVRGLAIGEYPTGTPWNTGSMDISAPIDIDVLQDVVIKDLYFYDDAAEIPECTVKLTSMGMTMDQLWLPGTDPLTLQAGDQVTLKNITIADEDLTKREYAKNLVMIIEYEQDGKTYCTHMDIQLIRRAEPYEVYLWAFKHVNTQAYYQQFLNIVRSVNFWEE